MSQKITDLLREMREKHNHEWELISKQYQTILTLCETVESLSFHLEKMLNYCRKSNDPIYETAIYRSPSDSLRCQADAIDHRDKEISAAINAFNAAAAKLEELGK